MNIGVICAVTALAAAAGAACAEPFALVAGRRDKELIVIDLARALDARNSGTGAAVVARVPVGSLPSGLLASADGRFAYVVNHGGAADQDAINHGQHALFQHGHRQVKAPQRAQSTFAPTAFTTSPYFEYSARINTPNSSGVVT
jgi:hypothetical protein